MADPKILYAVTAVVFAGLAVWLAFVFRTAKEPWAVAAGPAANKAPAAKPSAAPADEDDEEEDDDASDEEDSADVEDKAKEEKAG